MAYAAIGVVVAFVCGLTLLVLFPSRRANAIPVTDAIPALPTPPPLDPLRPVRAKRSMPAHAEPVSLKRYSEWELAGMVCHDSVEIDLVRSNNITERRDQLLTLRKSAMGASEAGWLESLAKNKNLDGLPLVRAGKCRTDDKKANRMREYARELRRSLRRREANQSSPATASEVLVGLLEEYRKPEAVPTLVQILEPEDESSRFALVRTLAKIQGVEATQALARRAVFDLLDSVRFEAVQALRRRRAEEYSRELLAALRYPWAPVANHAAEALVALDHRGITPTLVQMLDQPDPSEPFKNADGQWVQQQLIAVNHLRNCLMCHAYSKDHKDIIRGWMPVPGEPLTEPYYDAPSGEFVRADVVYLRQDFSITQPTYKLFADPGSESHREDLWPSFQRFDYLVRTRKLTNDEIKAWNESVPADTYPQRDAVLFALRQLTGPGSH
jgi:hypothetical protein